MWANPGLQSWPLQQSSFQNVPHEQVDWAALAKQWIAQRENADATTGDQMVLNSGQPPPPPPPQGETVSMHNDMEVPDGFRDQSAVAGQQQEWGWNVEQWNQSGNQDWNAGSQAHLGNGQTFDYGHGNGSVQESYDYDHGSGGEPYQVSQSQYYSQDVQQYQQASDSNYNQQYWTEPSSPERRNYKRSYSRRRSNDRAENIQEEDGIDAVKRKNLPAWIREGLEKMDREKQKALEKERKMEEKQMADQAKADAVGDLAKGQGSGIGALADLKSKFDSDDENAGHAHSRTPSPAPTLIKKSPSVKKRSPSPEVFKTDEEKQQDLMMRVRRMLTEVLLEVTNEEIDAIAQEVHHKERSRASKAPAQQLAKSNALASISNFGFGEESESDTEAQADQESESDSDTDLDERIQRRRSQYESKYGPISEDEYEEKPKETKFKTEPGVQDKTLDTPFPVQPMSESKSYHFEKQYAGIPGLDVTDDISETDHVKQSKSDTAKRSDKTRRKSSSDKKYSKKRAHSDSNKSRKKSKVTVTSSSSSSGSSSSTSSSGSSSSSSDSESSSNESPPSSKKKTTKRTKTRHNSKGEKAKSVKSLATPDKSRYYDDDVSKTTKRSTSKYAGKDRHGDDRYDLDKNSRDYARQSSRTVDDDYSRRLDTSKVADDYDRPRSRSSSRDRQGYQDLMKRIDNYHHKARSHSSSRDRDSHKSKSRKQRDDSDERDYYREDGGHRSREKHRGDTSYDRHSPDRRHEISGHSSHSKRREKEHTSSKSKRAKRSRSMSSETMSYSHRKSRRHSRSRSKESSRRKSSKSHSDKYTHRGDAERSGKKSSKKRRSRSRSR